MFSQTKNKILTPSLSCLYQSFASLSHHRRNRSAVLRTTSGFDLVSPRTNGVFQEFLRIVCSLELFQIGCWSWECPVNCHNRWVIKTLLNWHGPSVRLVYCKQFGGCPIIAWSIMGCTAWVYGTLYLITFRRQSPDICDFAHTLSYSYSLWLNTRAHDTHTHTRTHTPDEVLAQIPELPIRRLTAPGRDTTQKYRVCAAAQNTGPITHFECLRQIESNISAFIRILIFPQFWLKTGVTDLIFNNQISKDSRRQN